MASQFAIENGHRIARLLKYYDGPPYNIPELLDAELAEVREVLKQLAEWPFPVGKPCWCHLEGEHSDACQHARRLVEQLNTNEVNDAAN